MNMLDLLSKRQTILGLALSFSAVSMAAQPFSLVQRGAATDLKWNGTTFRSTSQMVQNPKLVRIPGTENSVLMWTEGRSSQPYYGITLDGKSIQRVNAFDPYIDLVFARFDPKYSVPSALRELPKAIDNQLYIVQFISQPLQSYHDAIEAVGGIVWGYCPENAYFCRLSEGAKAKVQALPFVRWVGAYEPSYRIEPLVRERLASRALPTLTYNVSVIDGNGRAKLAVAARLEILGGTVENAVPGGPLMRIRVTPDQLRQVATWNEIEYIDRWSAPEDDMDIVRNVMGANYLETVRGYTGQGVAGEVFDGGYRSTHQAFLSPPTFLIRNNTSDTNHGSSTTGIVFGDGTGNAAGRGMLPNGQGIFAAYTILTGFGGTQNRYTFTQPLSQAPYFACFQSNSWGSTLTTTYTNDSKEMDSIIFDQNICILNSQSNSGTQNSRPQAWAKNVVSVGGIRHFNTATLSDDAWNNGASIGPAADGRIKPDICGWYDSILCPTDTNDTAYTSGFGGTSAATPMTAGYFGLMFQMWSNGEFGNSALGATVFDNKPRVATAKALMTNLATQYPFTGSGADKSRYKQGWGLPDIKKVFDNRNNVFIVNEADVLQNLQTKSYRLYVAAGTAEFHATMCYADPAANAGANPTRINDLTLKVVAPDGTTYYGNNGLLAGNVSTPGGSPNTIDTLEHVIIANPASGVWTVTVSGDNINTDARVETPGVIDADYGLVVSGVVPTALVQTSFMSAGLVNSGSIAALETSNNQNMVFGVNELAADNYVDYIQQVVTSTVPLSALTQLRFRVESRASTGGTSQRVELYNFVQGTYEVLDTTTLPTSDGVREVAVTSNPSDFVDPGTTQVKARVTWYRLSDDSVWDVKADQERWFLTP